MLFQWLRRRRRRAILEQPFPEDWERHLRANVALWPTLTEADQAELRRLMQVFAQEKNWEGCGGFEVTDEVRVTISALACLLVLALSHDLYRRVRTILVYPREIAIPSAPEPVLGEIAIHSDEPMRASGEAHDLGGPVILAWDQVLEGSRRPGDGYNVVIHEFAHKLDMLSGGSDGVPHLTDPGLERDWQELLHRELAALRRYVDRDIETLLDPYAATNEAEFFACATEHFFDDPDGLADHHPELYVMLAEIYLQDPAGRIDARDDGASAERDAP